MKHKKLLFLLTPVLAFSLLTAGCSSKSVVSIDKTASYATEDVYTIKYSDGSTSEIVIRHGKDGQDGAVGVDELFEKYQSLHPDATYEQFVSDFLTVKGDDHAAVGSALSSCFEVYADFTSSASQGSAVLYRTSGNDAYIVTNYHVVFGQKTTTGWLGGTTTSYTVADKIYCYLYGSVSTPAKVNGKTDYGEYAISCTYVGGSIQADIAVLKTSLTTIHSINSNARCVTLASAYLTDPDDASSKIICPYYVGEAAYAIGNAEGEGISVTKGIVSVDSEYINLKIDNMTRSYRSVRIDTPLYSGNSGGGLFNANGELIGITNAGDDADQNINFAVPLPIVTGVVDNIIDHDNGYCMRVEFGATVEGKNSRYIYDSDTGIGRIEEDVTVTNISYGALAGQFNLKKNDVITGVIIQKDGVSTAYTIGRSFEIGELFYTLREGDSVKFKYTRSGVSATTESYKIQSTDFTRLT